MENQELKDKLEEIQQALDAAVLERDLLYSSLGMAEMDISCLQDAKQRILQALASVRGINESDLRDRLAKERNKSSPQPGTQGNGKESS